MGDNKFCCQQFSNGSYKPACYTNGNNCVGPDILCDGPEDCGGGSVCCGRLNTSSSFFIDMQCRAPGDCSYNSGYRVICTTDTNACPSGYVCKNTSAPEQYKYCGVP